MPRLTALLAATCAALLAASATSAQQLDGAPLILDVTEDSDDVLILAALEGPITAPQIVGSRSSGTIIQASLQQTGLPAPSIILGFIAPGQEDAFGIERLLPATVADAIFALDDLDAREALRTRDPELFRRLVEEGHLDPAETELNAVLQTELQRMNCYRSTIDGLWGGGSRRSVNAYFDELTNVTWDDPNPSNGLFRAILINGDVRCTVQQAAPVRQTAAPARTQQPARQQQAAPAQQQQQQQPSTGRLNLNRAFGGSGGNR